MLVLYSDGITDHLDATGREYGRTRLAGTIKAHCNRSAPEIVADIFAELDRFSTVLFDDQTLLVVKVK